MHGERHVRSCCPSREGFPARRGSEALGHSSVTSALTRGIVQHDGTVSLFLKVSALALSGLATAMLGGCETVEFGGATGVTVSEGGTPVAVLAVCKGQIDALTLYSGEGEKTVTRGDWSREGPITGLVTIDLASPPDGWVTIHPLDKVEPKVTYVLFGGTHDNRWATAHASFTTDKLEQLRPGEVLSQTYDEGAGAKRNNVDSLDDFRDRAC